MNPNLDPTQSHYRGFLERWSTGCRAPRNHSVLACQMKALPAAITAGLALGFMGVGIWSCSRPMQGPPAEPKSRVAVRFLITGDIAGTLEPCGCVKDQLGGLDRFATAVADARRASPRAPLLEVGSVFFPRASVEPAERDELVMRAETLAKSLRDLGLHAFAPGAADGALGEATFEKLTRDANLPVLRRSARVEKVENVSVGYFALQAQSTSPSPGTEELETQLKAASQDLTQQQAQLKVAFVDAPVGSVARAVRSAPGFQLVIVGGSSAGLGADSDGTEPQLIDSTLIVNPPNHLRGLVTIDFVIKGNSFKFADASGVGREEARMELGQRVVELAERVKTWKKEHKDPASIATREADLKRLREKLAELSRPIAEPEGSYFTFHKQPIGNNLERNPDMQRALEELGRRINLFNRDKFAGRKAPPPVDSEPTYIGVAACEKCHKEAVAFWRTTRHSHAYRTLVDKDRQYTLECVGCHVTGFEQPGGSSVTDVELLKDVQCENCHGPGSAHAKANTNAFIKPSPDRQLCATRCHHSPHEDANWSVNAAWPKIIGAGHGE